MTKKSSDKLLTKTDLEAALKKHPTKTDLATALSKYSTKSDLRVETAILKDEFRESFEQFDERNRGYRDEILTGLDRVMKELETIREDSVIGIDQTRELRVAVDNHEKRILTLEQV